MADNGDGNEGSTRNQQNTGKPKEGEGHERSMSDKLKEQMGEYLSLEEKDLEEFLITLKKKRLQEKLVYVISIATIVLLTHSLMASQWLLPYYYTFSTPCLIIIRAILYWQYRWHYFLLDFCYFGNLLWFCYIIIGPQNSDFFSAAFAVANGPLLWASVIFRNSLVLHSMDKVTSIYIHVLPAFLSFVLRWYPKEASREWFTPFVCEFKEETSLKWLFLAPFIGFFIHSSLLSLLTWISPPPKGYLTSYRCLTSKKSSFMFKAVNFFGPNFRGLLYLLFNWLYCILSLLLTYIWYNNFIAHSVFVGTMCLIITFNGANYYLDVFSKESEREKKKK